MLLPSTTFAVKFQELLRGCVLVEYLLAVELWVVVS